jgi:hypothetical protein
MPSKAWLVRLAPVTPSARLFSGSVSPGLLILPRQLCGSSGWAFLAFELVQEPGFFYAPAETLGFRSGL